MQILHLSAKQAFCYSRESSIAGGTFFYCRNSLNYMPLCLYVFLSSTTIQNNLFDIGKGKKFKLPVYMYVQHRTSKQKGH